MFLHRDDGEDDALLQGRERVDGRALLLHGGARLVPTPPPFGPPPALQGQGLNAQAEV